MASAEPVRVLVVDDQPPFRSAMRTLLQHTAGFALVGEAATGEAAVEQVAALAPDLVLLDVHLPGIDGIEAAVRILADAPGTVVLLCSTYDQAELPAALTRAGTAVYRPKADLGPAVLAEVWAAHRPST